jgi:RNA polymerase sigma-70 factor (ECF subfamily)
METAFYVREENSAREGAANFTTTHWSLVVAAGGADAPRAAAALEDLCGTYWYPLYAYVRRLGHNPDDAQDLVQEFFSRFLQRQSVRLADRNRGRFRTFLLTSLKRFLITEWTRSNREKRGGGQLVLSLDEELAEARLAAEPATERPPDALYDRGWAAILLDRAMSALLQEFEKSGKREVFERLKVFVWGEGNGRPYPEIAAQLGVSEGAVKVAICRLRQRFGELLRAEIGKTVGTPAEVNGELRYLLAVVRSTLEAAGNLPSGKS